MTPLPVSVCIISGAEERRIGRTLASVAGWVAEVNVVLNEEVTDGTEEICRAHGARVFREPWRGYGMQKNSATSKATQPWVLGLDADEVVTPELRDEIIRKFDDGALTAKFTGFSMPLLSFYAGRWIRHGDWYPDRKTRLWRRGSGRWMGEGGLHERLRVDGAVGELRADLLHFSYDNLNHHLAKLQTYSDLFAHAAVRADRRVGVFDLAVRPLWRFLHGYVLRLGFLDGWQGFVIAWMSALMSFLKYAKLREAALPGAKDRLR